VPHSHNFFFDTAFLPATVRMMGEAFDQAWASIEPAYSEQRVAEIESTRLALAKAIVMFTHLGNTDPDVLKEKALRVLKTPSDA